MTQECPNVPKINAITDSRRKQIQMRLKTGAFDIKAIAEAIKAQPFLMGENDRQWTVSLDWLIKNDTNFMKVLERRYIKATGPDGISPEDRERLNNLNESARKEKYGY